MFIAHYGIAYMVKVKKKEIPLWLLFLCVQLLDFVAFLFVLLTAETVTYDQNPNPFYRNEMELTYSHSLLGAVLISFIIYIIFWLNNKNKWGIILSLCVLSHWFLDLLVHRHDLYIFFGGFPVGFNLWRYPYWVFGAEIALFLSGWVLYKDRNKFSWITLLVVTGLFTAMVFTQEPLFIRGNDVLRTFIILSANCLFLYLAKLSDKTKINI